ncbi:unnamed protein product [Amoebophrya sp. A120]|nr:unnamed protein product [Amoebophrya sp. A120]|eukprot:GSA120T00024512001.1
MLSRAAIPCPQRAGRSGCALCPLPGSAVEEGACGRREGRGADGGARGFAFVAEGWRGRAPNESEAAPSSVRASSSMGSSRLLLQDARGAGCYCGAQPQKARQTVFLSRPIFTPPRANLMETWTKQHL